jgi:hypothetical protein
MEFACAGRGLGKGGKVTLYVDGEQAGTGEVDATLPMIFSAAEGCDVGEDSGAPVSADYGPRGNAVNGRVNGVQIAVAEAAEAEGHSVATNEITAARGAYETTAVGSSISGYATILSRSQDWIGTLPDTDGSARHHWSSS